MAGSGSGGFSLVEVLLVVVLAGSALGGVARLTVVTARAGGEGELRMKARWAAVGALERGRAESGQGPLRVAVRPRGGRREARVAWPGGGLRLEAWAGHE